MRRPHNAAPFMKSLAASDAGPHTVYAVADPDDIDTQEAWGDAGAHLLVSQRGHTFANKVQHAYLNTVEPWLLLVGDDVWFHPGWYQAALAVSDGFSLISTNDCGNPFVMAGERATHPIIRRTWVDESGASWDGPGVIAHEGYAHQFVDCEWSVKAHDDRVFVYAPDCRIEHLHPTWGHGGLDDVYLLGQSSTAADHRLFTERAAHR